MLVRGPTRAMIETEMRVLTDTDQNIATLSKLTKEILITSEKYREEFSEKNCRKYYF